MKGTPDDDEAMATDAEDVESVARSSSAEDSGVKSRAASVASSDSANAKTARPSGSALVQQEMPAWQPILTPGTVIPALFVLAVVFIPIGIVLLVSSASVQEYVFDYTDCFADEGSKLKEVNDPLYGTVPFSMRKVNEPSRSDILAQPLFNETGQSDDYCEITFSIDKAISGPVFQYYRLQNYYQNQRLYVRSVDWAQLAGYAVPRSGLHSNCAPLDGPQDDVSKVYYPCGLIANSYFSDVIGGLVPKTDGDVVAFSDKGIAYASEARRYGPSEYSPENVVPPKTWTHALFPQWIDENGKYKSLPDFSGDERFQNWMSVAGLPVFRKAYGRYAGNIATGEYTLLVRSSYNVAGYGARKAVVISNTSWVGGRSSFLGAVYVAVGGIFMLLALFFLARHVFSPRRLGDTSYLSWNQAPASPMATVPLASSADASPAVTKRKL